MRLKAMAADRAPTMATTIHSSLPANTRPGKWLSRNASSAPVSANGSAKTECSNLIISSVSRSRFQNLIFVTILVHASDRSSVVVVLLAGCDKPTTEADFYTSDITLPGGQVIKTEFVYDTAGALRGMQFRNSIAPDHGMLYAHRTPGKYGYWMYQTLIPLDMIWMDPRPRSSRSSRMPRPAKRRPASARTTAAIRWPSTFCSSAAAWPRSMA